MITGIYLLSFGDEHYVGQSVDVEKRWADHESNMLLNRCSAKMQAAYKKHGLPKKEMLAECHEDMLDLLESYFIQTLQPSINTVIPVELNDHEIRILEGTPSTVFGFSILDLIGSCAVFLGEHAEAIKERDKWIENCNVFVNADADTQLIEKLESDIDELHTILEDKDKTIRELEEDLAYAELPWYKKLFN